MSCQEPQRTITETDLGDVKGYIFDTINVARTSYLCAIVTDDIALIEMSEMGMQLMTEDVEKISRRVGLRMNAGKCKIWSAIIGKTAVIMAEETNVEVTVDFCYLGSYLSRIGSCDKAVKSGVMSHLSSQPYCMATVCHTNEKLHRVHEKTITLYTLP